MDESTVLCEITCDDGSVYKICSCIRGRLVEVNTRLLENPELLNTRVSFCFSGVFWNFLISSPARMATLHCSFPRSPMWWTFRNPCWHLQNTFNSSIVRKRTISNFILLLFDSIKLADCMFLSKCKIHRFFNITISLIPVVFSLNDKEDKK